MRVPRVRTPSVVDLPESTLPTTAQRTSGSEETFRGDSRQRRLARGCGHVEWNNTEAFFIINSLVNPDSHRTELSLSRQSRPLLC